MTNNNQELQDSIEYVNIGIERPSVELINDLNTALKAEQAKNTKYKKALKTIAERQDTSDSQDAIHAANTAIEALGKGEDK